MVEDKEEKKIEEEPGRVMLNDINAELTGTEIAPSTQTEIGKPESKEVIQERADKVSDKLMTKLIEIIKEQIESYRSAEITGMKGVAECQHQRASLEQLLLEMKKELKS